MRGAALNYRDIDIARGSYPLPTSPEVVPGSDGAGDVVKVGKSVQRFEPGDKVLTVFNQGFISGNLDMRSALTGLGGQIDGTFRQYGAFNEHGLVKMPSSLDYVEAATLAVAGLTAWNALFGLDGKRLIPGDWVLTQGTGGVSIFALQLAKASGARVIATTSSPEKAACLKELG